MTNDKQHSELDSSRLLVHVIGNETERAKEIFKTLVDCKMLSVKHVEACTNSVTHSANLHRHPDIIIIKMRNDEDEKKTADLCSLTRQKYPKSTILVYSSQSSSTLVNGCLQAGADNFLDESLDDIDLLTAVKETYHLSQIRNGSRTPPPQVQSIAVGETMQRIATQLPRILESAVSSILVTGESGTGKEIVCDLIEHLSCGHAPMVRINCGELVDSLAQGQLFGHVKGAYTGAVTDRKGLIEAADGGWLFLDEVTTLSVAAQTSLLRVLENREIRRLGDRKSRPINVRVLAATNEDIPTLVDKGLFRKDLWQRLREAEFHLLPLRQRSHEIPQLIEHFCKIMPRGPFQISKPTELILRNLKWRRGNIRELRNCLRMMTSLHVKSILTPMSIPERFLDQAATEPIEEKDIKPGKVPAANKLNYADLNYHRYADALLVELARKAKKDQKRMSLRNMASKLGVSRATLTNRLRGAVTSGLIGATEFADITGLSML